MRTSPVLLALLFAACGSEPGTSGPDPDADYDIALVKTIANADCPDASPWTAPGDALEMEGCGVLSDVLAEREDGSVRQQIRWTCDDVAYSMFLDWIGDEATGQLTISEWVYSETSGCAQWYDVTVTQAP